MQDAVHRPQQRGPSFVMKDDDDAGGGQGGAPLEFLVDAPPREKSSGLSKTGTGATAETPLVPLKPHGSRAAPGPGGSQLVTALISMDFYLSPRRQSSESHSCRLPGPHVPPIVTATPAKHG